jgi:hypothetical protein
MGGLGSREVLASRPAGRCPMWLALGLNAAWIYPQFWYVTGVTKPCFCHNAGHGRFELHEQSFPLRRYLICCAILIHCRGLASGSTTAGGDCGIGIEGRAVSSKYLYIPSVQISKASPAVMYSGLTVKPLTVIPGQILNPAALFKSGLNGRRRQALWYSQIK